jgi:hypothetical protein
MQFKTRYGNPIMRVLQNYQPGSVGLMAALEALCTTAELNGHKNATAELSTTVCENLHAHPSTGLKCLDCHNAETNYAGQQEIEAEMAMINTANEAATDAVAVEPEPVYEQQDELDPELLKKILSEIADD